MRLSELASVFSFSAPRLRGGERRLGSAVTIADLRAGARRAVPRVVFDFVDSGSEDEVAMRRNLRAFERTEMVPRVLQDVSEIETKTSILGFESALPLMLAPTGFTRLIHPGGEPAVARAAAAAGIPYAASTMSNVSLEEIAACPPGPRAFQLYMWRDRGVCAELVERAREAGFGAMVLTVDSQVSGLRERDLRNGLTIPPTIRPRTAVEGLARPGWALGFARGEQLTFANVTFATGGSSVMEYVGRELDTSLSWEAVDWLRARWDGPMAIKGILSAADAELARRHGADAVIVSNHGGRQLNSAPATLDVLPSVVEAAGTEVEVLLDSGVRRGADIAKAIALGARGCLIGRPYLYGLAAAGQPGVERAIGIFSEELRRTMALLGAPRIEDLRGVAVDQAQPGNVTTR
jgi:L-lactate dehydrogenase (cytochrome)